MARPLYNAAAYIAAGVMSPYVAWRAFANPEYRDGMAQKLGYSIPRHADRTIWIHAVSVGEALAAEGLVREIRKRAPGRKIVLSVTTPTGRDVAGKKMSDVAEIVYFPFDLRGAARRAVSAINPAVFVMVDTEIWPNVIWASEAAGARVAMVNGRISDRSYPRYRKMKWFFREVLENVDLFLMQGEADAERITDMGAPESRVSAAGNMKFDGLGVNVSERDREDMRRSLGLGMDEKVIFLGSVHEGEEAAIRAALAVMSGAPGVRLVIAPRRIGDIGWIERALEGSGTRAVRKTAMPDSPPMDPSVTPVIDTFGELARLYAVADVVFVGGSMIPHGGQNPLEPAAHGVAVVFGPSMSNFRDASSALIQAGAAWMVPDEKELARLMTELVSDDKKRARAGEAGREVVRKNRGVTARIAEKILELCR